MKTEQNNECAICKYIFCICDDYISNHSESRLDKTVNNINEVCQRYYDHDWSWCRENLRKEDISLLFVNGIDYTVKQLQEEIDKLKSGNSYLIGFDYGKEVFSEQLDYERNINKKLQEENDRLKALVPEWVSVEERLPNKNELVLAFNDWLPNSPIIGTGYFEDGMMGNDWDLENGKLHFIGGRFNTAPCYQPTYWQPLPQSPTGITSDKKYLGVE